MNRVSLRKKVTVVASIEFRMSEGLKKEIGRAADEAGLPMNEYMAQVMARHFQKPELGIIPRKSFGRPRKEVAESA